VVSRFRKFHHKGTQTQRMPDREVRKSIFVPPCFGGEIPEVRSRRPRSKSPPPLWSPRPWHGLKFRPRIASAFLLLKKDRGPHPRRVKDPPHFALFAAPGVKPKSAFVPARKQKPR
jgi:hypothetical protein